MSVLGPIGNRVATAFINRAVDSLISTATQTESRSGGNGVTTQRDVVTQYRKKRMPRKRKKRWVRKIKAFNAMMGKRVGTTSIVQNAVLEQSFANDGTNQSYLICHLYGGFGADALNREAGTRDIYKMLVEDDRVDEAESTFQFTGACLDVTGRNTGDVPLEVDMYIITHRGGKHRSSTESELLTAYNSVNEPPGADPITTDDVTLSQRGVTPFQLPYWTKYGNTILKKVKYFLPVDATFTYQWKDPKNYIVNSQMIKDFGNNFVCGRKGMTKTLMFVFKPIVGSPTTEENIAKLTIGHTRTYAYKVFQDNKDYNTFII